MSGIAACHVRSVKRSARGVAWQVPQACSIAVGTDNGAPAVVSAVWAGTAIPCGLFGVELRDVQALNCMNTRTR